MRQRQGNKEQPKSGAGRSEVKCGDPQEASVGLRECRGNRAYEKGVGWDGRGGGGKGLAW